MNCYYDCRDEIKSLGLSIDRANKIMSIIDKYFITKDSFECKVKKEVEKQVLVFKEKAEEAQKIIDNPQLVVSEMIEKIVCEHLYLISKSEMYSGKYVELKWDNKDLGSVCIERFED